MMPPPMVNHSREEPSEQPTISLALLLQVGLSPGAPGAVPTASAAAPTVRAAAAPQTQAAGERVLVVAQARGRRQLLQAHGVAAAQHDVVGLERRLQPCDDVAHGLAPFLVAAAFAAAFAHVILVRAAVLVGHMAKLGGLDLAIDDEGDTEAGAEPEEQHP